MKDYETVFVLHPRLDENQIEEEIGKVKDIITKGGGSILDVQRWGRKRLAYEIRKVHEGIFTLIQFSSEAPVIQDQDRFFKLNENILRHLTVIAHPRSLRRRDWEGEGAGDDAPARIEGSSAPPRPAPETVTPAEKPAEAEAEPEPAPEGAGPAGETPPAQA